MPGSDDSPPVMVLRIEMAAWTLIYGGLAVASLGLFVIRDQDGAMLGGTLIALGVTALVVGIVLIYVRSRMGDSSAKK
jgi:hypothetical protein